MIPGRHHLIAIVALVLLAGSPETVRAGAWTQPKGTTWFRAGTMFQSTNERYFIDGSRIPYFFEGHNRTMGFFFDFEHGITERLEVNAHLPFFGIAFNDLADDRQSNGIGDVRVGARYNLLSGPLVATIGGRIKFPTGEFANDAEIIPVGEGQYDFELKGELAHSFWPHPAYVTGLIGTKFRTKKEEDGISYGDEIFWSAEGGYDVSSRIMLKIVFGVFTAWKPPHSICPSPRSCVKSPISSRVFSSSWLHPGASSCPCRSPFGVKTGPPDRS